MPPLGARPVVLDTLPNGKIAVDGGKRIKGSPVPLQGARNSETGSAPAAPLERVGKTSQGHIARPAARTRRAAAARSRAEFIERELPRLLLLALLGLVWALLEILVTITPSSSPTVATVMEIPEDGYGLYEPETVPDPVLWMSRIQATLLVEVDHSWVRMEDDERLELLQQLWTVGESPEEILVMGENSELRAEVYWGQYHIYQ